MLNRTTYPFFVQILKLLSQDKLYHETKDSVSKWNYYLIYVRHCDQLQMNNYIIQRISN